MHSKTEVLPDLRRDGRAGTTDGVFKKGSEAPFSSDGMVTFAQAIREGKMDKCTDDFKKLTGSDPITVKYMFEHSDDFRIGERHSKDK